MPLGTEVKKHEKKTVEEDERTKALKQKQLKLKNIRQKENAATNRQNLDDVSFKGFRV